MKAGLTDKELPGGIRLIASNLPGARSIEITIAIKAGYGLVSSLGSYFPAETPHLLEHMLFDGSRHFPTSDHLLDVFSRGGGEFNGETSLNGTFYSFKTHPTHAVEVVEAALDMVYSPELTPKSFNEELAVVSNELSEKMSDYAGNAQLYNQHQMTGQLRLSADHLARSLRNIKFEHVSEFHRRFYGTANTIIFVTGDLAKLPLSKLELAIAKASQDARKSEVVPPLSLELANKNTKIHTFGVRTPRGSSYVIAALDYVATQKTVEQKIKASLMAHIFIAMCTNMKSYSIQSRLRKQGLGYGLDLSQFFYGNVHGLSFVFESKARSFVNETSQIMLMVRDLAKKGIDDKQYALLLGEISEAILDQTESSAEQMHWLIDKYFNLGLAASAKELAATLAKISQKEVLSYARKLLNHNRQYATVFAAKAIDTAAKTDLAIRDALEGRPPQTVKTAFLSDIAKIYGDEPGAKGFYRLAAKINQKPVLAWLYIIIQITISLLLFYYWYSAANKGFLHVVALIIGLIGLAEATVDIAIRSWRRKNQP